MDFLMHSVFQLRIIWCGHKLNHPFPVLGDLYFLIHVRIRSVLVRFAGLLILQDGLLRLHHRLLVSLIRLLIVASVLIHPVSLAVLLLLGNNSIIHLRILLILRILSHILLLIWLILILIGELIR